ncbi:MAG: hypothetical protein MRY78_13955 [Saprospiraceae bacterium]|nr:hypothetical protein [Saprospiraceae bacterium]
MGLFDRLFGHPGEEDVQPNIKFGRYSDSYKAPENYNAWDLALEAFEEERYLECYRYFFRYLRDDAEDNVRYWDNDEKGIEFEIYQGSVKITGCASNKRVRAEAKVVRTEALNVSFMRRLIEQNFELKYSRFALDTNQNIAIVFDTYSLDGSPYKLYYALKELATRADKHDDLLLDEFRNLQAVDNDHLEELPHHEKEVKYDFLVREINRILKEIETGNLNKEQYPGGIAYLLLSAIYKLDFLVVPEGFMMETLERIHREYFNKDGKSTIQKNQILCKELKKLIDRPKDDFFKEMYRVKSTFGITTPVNHDRIVSFIDNNLNNMDWYEENGYSTIAMAIPAYIVGFCMFNYAVPGASRDFFLLYFQVIEQAYFDALGFNLNLRDQKSGKLDKKRIKRAIERVVEKNKPVYTKLNPIYSILKFDSLPAFAKSYLLMVRNLDMTKAD